MLSAGLVINCLRVTENSVLTSFTVQMDNTDLVYKDVGGISQAAVNVYAKITQVSGRRAGLFEDVVTSSYVPEALEQGMQAKSAYQKNIVLPPGNYKVDLVVRDVNSGKTGIFKQGFVVPKYNEGELAHSTLVLASRIEPLNGKLPTGQFVLGALKVIPNATAEFKQDQNLGIYMQVYNVQIDQATLRPSVDIEYVITQHDKEVLRVKEDGKNSLSTINSQQITLAHMIPLKQFKPGSYDVAVIITDHVAGKSVTAPKDTFQIVAAPKETAQSK